MNNKLSKCPLCGAKGLRQSNEPFDVIGANGVKRQIKGIKRLICPKCKDEFFDHSANQSLDRYRGKQKATQKKAMS